MEPQETVKPRKRKRARWIVLTVLVLLIAGIIAVGLWQRNNLEAVAQFSQLSQEELEKQLEENDAYVKELLEAALNAAQEVDQNRTEDSSPPSENDPDDAPPVSTTQQNPETDDDAQEPPKTEQPAATTSSAATTAAVTTAAVTTAATAKASTAATTKASTAAATAAVTTKATTAATTKAPAAESGPTYEAQLKALVEKVYALRAEYLQALETLQAEAIADYKAIPAANRTAKGLMSFVSKYLTKGTELERECDKKMDALMKELTALLKKYDQDLELVDAVKYTYAQEKSLKKAWYMSELESRGLI